MGMWGGGGGGWGGGGGGGWGGAGRTRLDDEDQSNKIYDFKLALRLLSYLKSYKLILTAVMATMAVSTFSHVAGPLIIGYAIDHYITNGDINGLSWIVLVFLGNSALAWGANYLNLILMAKIGQGILFKMRAQMFDHLQKQSMSFYDKNETGRIMSRVQNDVSQIQDTLSQGFLSLGDAATLVGIIIAMIASDLNLALATLVVIPILAVTMIVWQSYARRAFMRTRRSIAIVNAKLQENIAGVRAIQSMNREKINMEQFDKLNNANFNANVDATRLSSALMPVIEILSALSIAIVVMYGGYLAMNGSIQIGLLVTFTLFAQRFFEPIRSITQEYASFQRAMVAGHRIFEVLDTKPDVQDLPNAIELPTAGGEIVFNNVNFHYNKEVPILKDFNLHIQSGENIALVGPTGAGKSTVISLLSRFYDVSSGNITIDGHDLRDIKHSSLAKQIAMVLQDPFLFTGNIRENIRYGRLDATDAEVENAAKIVGLQPFVAKQEKGYDTPIFERGVNLSVGQRQLISFARAVLADPRILILDEATANIDTQTEIVIQQALKTLLKGRTSIVIAHRLSTIKDADRVIVIEDGRITEQGTHMDLLRASGTYERLYTMSYQLA